jgi:ABC-type multidrug transport system fused ATPase/permease subunit
MYRPQPNQPQRQVLALPDAQELPALIVSGVTRFAYRHKYLSGAYIIGLLFLVLVGKGTQLSFSQQREYNRLMNTIDLQAEYNASNEYWKARNAYHATKGWFSCDGLCQRNKARMDEAERFLFEVRREGEARMSDAKAVAGLWSEIGIGEVRDSFWQYFNAGKQFAKRQSMWDAMFIGIRQISRGRDESWIEYAVKLLMQVLINFSIGLLMALAMFVFGLWSIVRSYQPNPFVAVFFFVAASCAAFSFVATYLMAIFGSAAGGIYGVVKLAETSARAQLAEQQRQQRVRDRPHHD